LFFSCNIGLSNTQEVVIVSGSNSEIAVRGVEQEESFDDESVWLSALISDCCLIAVTSGDNDRIKRLIKKRKKTMSRRWKATNSVLKKLIKSRDVSSVVRLGFDEISPLDTNQ